MKNKPYDWQNNAVVRFARAVYFALIVDCGCGKTLAAIMIALEKMKPVIIIAPTHRLCAQWKEAIEENVEDADVWLYSRSEDTKQKELYKERFEEWLAA
jgi:superfamily II DNA or RNA helicase